MRKFRFTTKISSTGKITIPLDATLYNKEVDIIILPKKNQPISAKNNKAVNFVEKRGGFLQNKNTSDAKFTYLMEKHK